MGKAGPPKLKNSKIIGKALVGPPFKFRGSFTSAVDMNGPKLNLECYVLDNAHVNIMGLPWIKALEEAYQIPLATTLRLNGAQHEVDGVQHYSDCRDSDFCTLTPVMDDVHRDDNVVQHILDAVHHTPEGMAVALKSTYPQVFDTSALGHCTKFKTHLLLKPGSNPVFCRARPVPHGVQEAVDQELDRLVAIGAIKKVDYSK